MEKRAVIAFGLILLIWVLVSTPFYQELMYGPLPQDIPVETPESASSGFESDTTEVGGMPSGGSPKPKARIQDNWDRDERLISLQDSSVVKREARQIVVESDLYRGVLDTRGGVIRSWRLKNYKGIVYDWVELIPGERECGPDIRLSSEEGLKEFSQVVFNASQDSLKLSDSRPTGTIALHYTSATGLELIKRYTFSNDSYAFNMEIELRGDAHQRLGSKYFVRWGGGLRITEPDRQRDIYSFRAFAKLGEEVEEQDLGSDEFESKQFSGDTKWVGVRSKYFFAGIVPLDRSGLGCRLSGRPVDTPEGPSRQLAAEIEMGLTPAVRDQYRIYLGPVDYGILSRYGDGLEEVVYLGWSIIRPFSLIILRTLVWMHQWISNYGIVIILLSIIIKILLYPLTYKSMMAAQGMQQLAPEMEKLKEKYKGDPQKMNREVMALYKKHGVNPLGGCLPMLLQMPILYGLYVVFSSTIELRGASFGLWIDDLSRGASGFTDPYIILPLLMAVTMLIQSKMTMKDPRQAAFVYMMPVMLLIFMYSLPSGLILYWTMINILTIIQQYIQNRFVRVASA